MATISRLLGVLAAGLILAGCGAWADNSQKIVNDIKVNGSDKLVVASGMPSDFANAFTATIADATCAQSGSSQNYSCVVHFTVTSAIVQPTAVTANISATCDDAGTCKWHVTNAAPA
jgi:hypothetical protein